MFATMHDRTRRKLCRWAFVLFCIVPTVWVVTLITYRHSPLYHWAVKHRWEEQLHAHLGLAAQLQRVTRPRRHVWSLEGVSLFDPESERKIARLRVLELTQSSQATVLVASQPEIENGQFLRLCEALHDRVLRELPPTAQIHFAAREITLLGAGAQTFTDVQALVSHGKTGSRLQVAFGLAGGSGSARAELQVLRNPQIWPPTTGWQLRTGSTPIPCALFAAYLPQLNRLGSDCRFQGDMWVDSMASSWNGEISGRFTGVDLDRLTAPFPHKLSGNAELVLRQARFRDGQLQTAAGQLHAGGGVISTSLVEAMRKTLHLQGAEHAATKMPRLLTYEQLACGFELEATQLRLAGLCQEARPGTILLGSAGPLLSESGKTNIPAVALARALSPASQFQIPATAEARALIGTLPLPTASARPSGQARRPSQATVRLRDE